jgi:hypothetical protein
MPFTLYEDYNHKIKMQKLWKMTNYNYQKNIYNNVNQCTINQMVIQHLRLI